MAIEAGDGGVQHAVFKPLNLYIAGEIAGEDLGGLLHPRDTLAFPRPEGFRVAGGFGVERVILRGIHTGRCSDFGFYREERVRHGGAFRSLLVTMDDRGMDPARQQYEKPPPEMLQALAQIRHASSPR